MNKFTVGPVAVLFVSVSLLALMTGERLPSSTRGKSPELTNPSSPGKFAAPRA